MTQQQPVTTSACPHPEAVGTRWGDPISQERQAELQRYLDRWAVETDHGERKGPFEEVQLTGADASWLSEQTSPRVSGRPILENIDLHLEGARLYSAHLEGAFLNGANMEGAHLYDAHLEGAHLFSAHLERVGLNEAHLEGAYLYQAYLGGWTSVLPT